MPLDGFFLASLRKELEEKLLNARITRVYQPGKRELNVTFRSPGQNHHLLISAHPQLARVHLTTIPRENPLKPPSFCMLLRKHWEGGRLVGLFQPDLERVLILKAQNMDEFGLVSTTELICEVMGRHSNAILVKRDRDGAPKILGSLITVSPGMSRVRTVQTGEAYEGPPPQEKFFPGALEGAGDRFLERLGELGEKTLKNSLVALLQGIGPLTAEALLARAGLDPETRTGDLHPGGFDALFASLLALKEDLKAGHFRPSLLRSRSGEALDFAALKLPGKEAEEFSSPSLLLDSFFGDRERQFRERELSSQLQQTVLKKLERLQRKLERQQEELKQAEEADTFRRHGEILTAFLHRVQKGQDFALLPDIYDARGGLARITLDPSLTPAGNAQACFRKYKKALSARRELTRRTRDTAGEIRYLEGLHFQLQGAALPELLELQEELAREGYLPGPPAARARPAGPAGTPLKFLSSDGLTIYVGKNNRQNEWLTLKKAGKEDLWFHVKDLPGSHVVVTHSRPPYKTLEEAALLAAYYSRGRSSAQVPVDYTRVKNVRKPKGGRPGMVIYDQHRTLYVTPARDRLPPPASPE